MQQFHFSHSLKNIPLPSKKQYQSILISKVESFIQRIRFKLYVIQNDPPPSNNNYGFKTPNSAPPMEELKAFEDDIYKLITSIEFKQVNSEFQNSLKNIIKKVKESPNVIIHSDKTKNMYTIPPAEYKKILTDNITKEYKKSDNNKVNSINKEAAKLAKDLNIADRVDSYIQSEAFITVKDHKENFPDRVDYRLLNPAKSNIGKISKKVIESCVNKIKIVTSLNLWQSSDQVIQWFQNLKNKERLTFFKFDVVSFYPSITEKLFDKVINWAKELYNFSDIELNAIKNTRKSFIFLNKQPWIKKNDDNFDITMGSFDGAECCELVGLYILNSIKSIIDSKSIGLYRDDGLAAISGTGPQVEKIRKEVFKLFKELDLKVTIEGNLTSTDFLDVHFNLRDDSFRPFKKANADLTYINVKSNHPSNIKKQLPKMVNDRISKLSSSEQIFNTEHLPYKDALTGAGYTSNMTYIRNQPHQANARSRRKKVIWFNPPFSETVKTNVANQFLSLVNKHFKNTPLNKYFNRSTIKVSYCCMPNIKNIIAGHNKFILKKLDPVQQPARLCNCRGGQGSCPAGGRCLQESVVYKAQVNNTVKAATYIGLTANEFKTRYNQHISDFRLPAKDTSTTLCKFIHELNDNQVPYNITWNILASTQSYNPASGKCNLCNLEKVLIVYSKDKSLLNKRTEINNKCRHRAKFLLKKHLDVG